MKHFMMPLLFLTALLLIALPLTAAPREAAHAQAMSEVTHTFTITSVGLPFGQTNWRGWKQADSRSSNIAQGSATNTTFNTPDGVSRQIQFFIANSPTGGRIELTDLTPEDQFPNRLTITRGSSSQVWGNRTGYADRFGAQADYTRLSGVNNVFPILESNTSVDITLHWDVSSNAPSFRDATGDAQIWTAGTAITNITVPEATGDPAPTYAAQGTLPDGIAFNTATRVISGTPTTAGTGTITIRASNSEGHADWTVGYTIKAVAAAPTVTINPVASGREGTTVQLGAALVGGTYDGTPIYAWTVSGGTLDNAASATPTWTRPQVNASGDYTIGLTIKVAGTGTNAANGTTDTATASRTVRVTDTPATPNTPPTAEAGPTQNVAAGATVTLSGSGDDSDGTIASYAWSQDSGTNVTLSGANTATATFTAPSTSSTHTLVFRLTVTDDDGDTGEDTVTINVAAAAPPTPNVPPTAEAGPTQNVAAGATVTLSGSGQDSDGTIASYAWSQDSGTNVTLSGANTSIATFTAPSTDSTHTLVFRLTVTDDDGDTGEDTVTINVAAAIPDTPDTPPRSTEVTEGQVWPQRSLTETMCSIGNVPNCPQIFIFIIPLVGLAGMLSMGVRHPLILSGVVVLLLSGTSIAIKPNILMIALLVLGAAAIGVGVMNMSRR